MKRITYYLQMDHREGLVRTNLFELKIPNYLNPINQRALAFEMFEKLKAVTPKHHEASVVAITQNNEFIRVQSNMESEAILLRCRQTEYNTYLALGFLREGSKIVVDSLSHKQLNGQTVKNIIHQKEDAEDLKKLLASINKIASYQF